MKAIVMIIFALFCLPIRIIQIIYSLFVKEKKREDILKSRVDNAIKRELHNSIKRRLSVFIIILSSFCAQAQIASHGSIEMGYRNSNLAVYKGNLNLSFFEYDNLYADLKLDFSWKFIQFSQVLSNNFKASNAYTYKPIDIDYKTIISLKYKKFSIGYEHSCLHPVLNDYQDLKNIYLRGGEDKVFLRFEW